MIRPWMLILVSALLIGLFGQPALALDPSQREQMKKHFAGLGNVKYELFAPLGGMNVGAVLLSGGGGDELRVVKLLDSGGFSTVYSSGITSAGLSGRQPFTFLLAGRHLLTYPTTLRTGPNGEKYEFGDLSVYDITAEGGARLLFTLPGVADLGVQPAGSLNPDSILRQPSRHFLNNSGRLPKKYDYYRLSFDEALGQYRIYHHLTPLPDPATIEADNLNNRALADYYSGRLMDAARGLERAAIVVEVNQSTVYRNQNLIKSEIDDLAAQARLKQGMPGDDALLAFWQGDFALVTRLMDLRPKASMKDHDYAMLGIALAHQRRWPEADRMTARLASERYPYIGDYAAELVRAAELQNLPQVVEIQLRALEHLDPGHAGLAAALARVLLRAGQTNEAETFLNGYLARNAGSDGDLSAARMELFAVYDAAGNQAGMDRLLRDALSSNGGSLRSFVAMADYIDFTRAYAGVPLQERDRLKAPRKPLDMIGEAPPGFTLP